MLQELFYVALPGVVWHIVSIVSVGEMSVVWSTGFEGLLGETAGRFKSVHCEIAPDISAVAT